MIKLRSLPLHVTLCIPMCVALCVLPGAFLFPALSQGQGVAPAVRIVSRIDESQLVTLRGNTHPFANARHDQGKVADSLPMTDLILVLSRDPAQQAAFDAYVAGEYDQNSPNYHQWLTPDQIGEQFGPSQTDILTITNWLTGHGFTVSQVTRDRMSIRFGGTAAQVESAFHTEIHNLTVKGEAHIGNMTDPEIPAALATVVIGVKALHNFFPRPMHRMGQTVQRDASTGKWVRQAPSVTASAAKASAGPDASRILLNHPANLASPPASSATVKPQFGISVGGSSPYEVEDVDPWDFATIYNILPLWNKSAPIDGSGQTIAIAGTSDIDVGQASGSESANGQSGANGNNDVLTFRTYFGLPIGNAANTPKRIPGNTEPLTVCTDTTGNFPYPSNPCEIDDLTENSLDVEWSGSIAKNAQIILVASYPASATDDNLYDSESYIVDNLTARIMNVSYGECELSNGTAANVQYYDLWQTAAAEGISVFVAAGDSGSASCDDGYSWAASGLTVSGLASTPWNTAVGGTDFNWCNPDTANGSAETECPAAPYWSSTPITSQGSTAAVTSALGYVPEVPWNESCANPLTLKWVQDAALTIYGQYGYVSSDITSTEQACNFLLDEDYTGYSGGVPGLGTAYSYILYLLSTTGGSGGASNCVVGTAVTNNNTGEISGCSAGATTTGPTMNPDPPNNPQASLTLVNNGWPKPSWQTGVSGIPSDGVRDIPDVSFFASDGYVSSSAYLICVSQANSGNAPCSYSTYTEPFYQEVGGTSVATPAMAGVMALINQKTGATQGFANPELYKLAATQNYSSCSAESVTAGSATCMFNDIDQETNALPCDAYDATPNCTASSSTFGYPDSSVENGLGLLTGYNATTGFDLATGLGSLNVANVVNAWVAATPGSAAPTITVTPNPTSINSSNSLSVTVTVAGATGAPQDPDGQTIPPTGSVTLTASGSTYTATGTLNSSGSYTFTIPANNLPGTSSGEADTLTASYTGDVNYAAKTGTGTVTVTTSSTSLLTPVISVTPTPSTIDSSASLTVTVSVTGAGVLPTGTITLSASSGSYTATTETIGTAPCTSNTNCTFTIPANSLGSGTTNDWTSAVTLTAKYSGDSNYAAGQNTGSVNVTESSFTLTPGTPSSTSVTPGQSATVTVTAAATAGYTGTLTLTCAQTGTTASGGDGTTCTGGGNSQINLATCGTSCSVTFTIGTYAPVTAALARPELPGGGNKGWLGAGSGAVLALLVFFGIPARRRSWRSMLSILVALVAIGTLASCSSGGGSGGGGGGGGQSDPGTLAGTYTYTVTVSATPSVTPPVTQTFTVTVN
jgi:subtilase family serine protease